MSLASSSHLKATSTMGCLRGRGVANHLGTGPNLETCQRSGAQDIQQIMAEGSLKKGTGLVVPSEDTFPPSLQE